MILRNNDMTWIWYRNELSLPERGISDYSDFEYDWKTMLKRRGRMRKKRNRRQQRWWRKRGVVRGRWLPWFNSYLCWTRRIKKLGFNKIRDYCWFDTGADAKWKLHKSTRYFDQFDRPSPIVELFSFCCLHWCLVGLLTIQYCHLLQSRSAPPITFVSQANHWEIPIEPVDLELLKSNVNARGTATH